MTKRIISMLLFIMLIIVGCSNSDDGIVPTQISLPTDAPTEEPTQTPAPTDIPLPVANPTDLFIPRTSAENPNDQAYLRIIHASPNLGIVDVYIEALAVATNVDYARFTERQDIAAGTYKLRVLPTGSFVSDTPLYEQDVEIIGGDSLVFVMTGTDEALSITTLSEPNKPLRSNQTRLTMLNAIEGAENLVMVVDDIPQTSNTPYLQLSEITEHKTGVADFVFQNGADILFDNSLELRPRQNYIFLLTGILSRPDTLEFTVLSSIAPGVTTVSFVNASPSIGLVDLYFGDNLILGGADFGEISVPESILSGTYDLSIYPELANPDDAEPITGTQFIANPDEDIVLVLIGEPNTLRFVIYRNDLKPTYDNQARITFINALEDVYSIFLNSTDETLNQRLSYGRTSDTYDIDTDRALNLTWIQQLDDVQDIALETFSDFTPTAGTNYLYIFSASGYEPPILFDLNVGTIGFDFAEVVPVTQSPSTRPTRIRLVNMWDNEQFTVRLDGTVIAEGMSHGSSTNPVVVNSGEHVISFHNAATLDEGSVVEINAQFDAGKDYSVVAYNRQNGDGNVLLIPDEDIVIASATGGIRLIVLDAEPDSLFGIGYSQSNPNVTQPDASDEYRRSLQLGITQIIREVPVNEISDTQRIPLGTYNIRIIDNKAIAMTYTHPSVTIEAQTLYNVFLKENWQTGQTNTTIVPYSAR